MCCFYCVWPCPLNLEYSKTIAKSLDFELVDTDKFNTDGKSKEENLKSTAPSKNVYQQND